MNRIVLGLAALLVLAGLIAIGIYLWLAPVAAPAPTGPQASPTAPAEQATEDPAARKVTDRVRTGADPEVAEPQGDGLLAIAGTVRGEDGTPLAGVTVHAALMADPATLPVWERAARDAIPGNAELEDALDIFRASMDVGAMGGALDQFRDDDDELDVEALLQSGNDALDEMDAGDVRSSLRAAGGPEEMLRSFNRLMTVGPTRPVDAGSAATDETGAFRIEGLEAGKYRLRAEATGFARTYVRADAGREDLNLLLPAATRFGGKLISSSGGAVVGAQLNHRGDVIHVGEDGLFSIEGGRIPREPLYVAAPGYVSVVVALKLTGESSDEDFVITLSPAGSVAGQVLALGGGPVEGADVMTSSNLLMQIGMAAWMQRGAEVITISVPALTTTDAQGRYALDGVGAGSVVVSARKTGYLPGRSEKRALDQGRTVSGMDVMLTKEAVLVGTVTDAEGGPVPGAKVTVTVPNNTQGIAGMAATFFGNASEQATTGSDGLYRVKGIPGGSRDVKAEAPGFLTQRLTVSVADGVEARQDFALEPGLRLAGTVYDPTGEPVASANVSVSWPDPGASTNPMAAMMGVSGPKGPSFKTDESGHFEATGLQAGPYNVTASHDEYVDVSEVDVAAGREDVDLTLIAAAALRGIVVSEETGEPIPRAEVVRKGGPRDRGSNPFLAMLDMGKRIRADNEGRFSIPGLAAGSYELWARGKGFADSTHERIKLAEGEVSDELKLVMPNGESLMGRVMRLDGGGPVADALVFVSRSSNPMMSAISEQLAGSQDGRTAPPNSISTRTDSDGRFVLEGLNPGTASVEVRSPEYANATKRGVAVPASDVEIVVGVGGVVEGIVLDENDRPVIGSTVMIQTGMGMGQRAASTDARGHYRHERITPGRYMVISMNLAEQESPLAGMNMKSVQVREGETTVQDFVEENTGTPVSGVVLKDGQPLAEATVLATGGPSGMQMTQTGEDGSFKLKNLEPGEYRVMVQTDFMGGGNSSQTVTVIEGQDVESLRFELSSLKVEGTVIDATTKQPISAAHVAVMSNARGAVTSMNEAVGRQRGQAFTDGDGQFTIEGVPEGEFTLRIAAGGYAAEYLEQVRGGGGRLKIELSSGVALDVTVTDAAGAPLARASVFAEDSEGREGVLFDATMQGTTDGEGVATLQLAPGRYTMHAQASGHTSKSVVVNVQAATAVTIQLPAGGGIDVQVADASGTAVQGAVVTLRDAEGKLVERRLSMNNFLDAVTQTDASGSLVRNDVPEGEFTVVVVHPDGRRGEATVQVSPGGTTKVAVTIE